MTNTHNKILNYIREQNSLKTGKTALIISQLTDEELKRTMFSSYRGSQDNTRGLRLTGFGLLLMQEYYKSYAINMPENYMVTSLDIIFLDQRASLPYFFDYTKIVLFETELGMMLKLAGSIANLIKIERG